MADDKLQQDPTMEEILQSIKRIIAEDGPAGGSPEGAADTAAPVDAVPESIDASAEEEDVLELTDMVMEPDISTPDDSHDILADIDAITKAIESDEPLSVSGGEEDIAEPIDEVIAEEATPMVADEMPVELEMVDEEAPSSVEAEEEIHEEDIHEESGADDFKDMDISMLENAGLDETDEEDQPAKDLSMDEQEERGLLSPQAAANVSSAFKEFIDTLPHQNEEAQPVHSGLVTRSGTTVEDLLIEALQPLIKDWFEANLPATVERIVRDELRKLIPR
ncbi:DUF2497 domain-containing protein [bacterium]|nr:DUF2497 domain-containing protein [bacterium]